MALDAVYTHVKSPAMPCYHTVKLTTDLYQFGVAHSNLQGTFQSHFTSLDEKNENLID